MKKKPPAALAPVRAILDQTGYGPLVYTDENLRRDRLNRYIPLPGRAGATVSDAAEAALVCARAREESGHMCPVVGWYLLARSPETEAHARLRAELDTAVGRVADLAARGTMRLPAISDEAEAQLREAESRMSAGIRVALSQIAELAAREDRGDIEAVFEEMLVEPQTPQWSPTAAFREATKGIFARIGEPLRDPDVLALLETLARSSSQAKHLHELLTAHESSREHARGPAVVLTDLPHLRELLAEAPADLLRETLLKIIAPQIQGMGHAELRAGGIDPHGGEACKPACDHAAWLLCFLLDPANRAMWEVLQGDPDQLVTQAVVRQLGQTSPERLPGRDHPAPCTLVAAPNAGAPGQTGAMSLRDPDDVLSGWIPAHDPGPAPDLSLLDDADPLVAEWLLADHPWAESERTRRREAELREAVERAHPDSPPWIRQAEIDAAEPDQAYVARMRRSLEARRQLDDPAYVYPPALMGPMGSLWPPPGHPPHAPGVEAGGWNLDAP